MISEYLFKGIDHVFHPNALQIKNHQRPITKQLIKASLHTVIRGNNQNIQKASALKKSRLRTIIDKNRSSNLSGVIRRDNSKSPSPYQKISAKINSPKNQKKPDKIVYYREQRKNIEKYKVLEKSRKDASNSRILKANTPTKMNDERSLTPTKNGTNSQEQGISQYKHRNTSLRRIKTQPFHPI